VTAEAVRVAIDLGGTGARVSVIDRSGRRVFDAPGWDTNTGALGHLSELIETVAATEKERGRPLVVAAGLTGLNGVVPPVNELGEMLHERFGVDSLVIADDSLTSALGATGGRPGVVLAVGTGAVALGLGPNGEVARVDGGGGFLGDRGSGWWIGRQGLIAAVSELDGREDGSADLLSLAVKRYGPISSLPKSLRESDNPFRDIARFSSDVALSARGGDPMSMRIFERAGTHLATAGAAAALRSNQSQPVPVFVLGGVSRAADLFFPTLFETLSSLGIDGVSRQSQGDALRGAEALLGDRLPLSTDLISTWKRQPLTES
jgi:glucosamine kinase